MKECQVLSDDTGITGSDEEAFLPMADELRGGPLGGGDDRQAAAQGLQVGDPECSCKEGTASTCARSR